MAKHSCLHNRIQKTLGDAKKVYGRICNSAKSHRSGSGKPEKNSNQNQELSPEEQLWLRAGKHLRQSMCIIHKEVMKALLRTADFEKINKVVIGLKIFEFQVVFYCQKTLKECSLEEVTDGIIQTLKTVNLLDAINYINCGSYYSLEALHRRPLSNK